MSELEIEFVVKNDIYACKVSKKRAFIDQPQLTQRLSLAKHSLDGILSEAVRTITRRAGGRMHEQPFHAASFAQSRGTVACVERGYGDGEKGVVRWLLERNEHADGRAWGKLFALRTRHSSSPWHVTRIEHE